MNPLHEQFVTEARELIDQASDDLIALERDGFSAERIDRIFRAFHTLKGSAGLVELPAMSLTLHAAEDLMAAVRAGRLQPGAEVISRALECLDQVSQWVDAFDADGMLPPSAGENARAMTEKLRSQFPQDGEDAPLASPGNELPQWAARLIEIKREAIIQRIEERPEAGFAISYEPHAGCYFDGEDPLQLLRQIPHLVEVHVELRDDGAPLAEIDPFECRLRLLAIAGGDRDELSAIFRLVPDQVRIIDLRALALKAEEPDNAALIQGVVEEQLQMLRVANSGEDFVGRIGAAARAVANALRHGRRDHLAALVTRAAAAARAQRDASLLLTAIGETLDSLTPERRNGDSHAGPAPAGRPAQEPEARANRWLRVDQSRVDALVNLAGELVVLRNSFAHLARRIESEFGDQDLSRAVKGEQDTIERLAGDMHDAILQLRMVPIGQAFRPLPRLMRDLARRLHKKVQLVTRGEATPTDKAVVDRLFEPLMHLVRNALDHGIETPAERRAAGKAETASLTLEASRLGDRIVVEVSDDGRGIDPAIIGRKARERGLLASDALSALPDEQMLELIFSTGLSTAAQITDVSGRGVGMDVVRTTVDQIGGRVSLTTRAGAGTTVRLDVPVNIATSRIMVIECAGQTFGIPMDAVAETVRVTSDRIRQIKNNEGFVLRDRVVPICSLAELMNLPGQRAPASDARLVIVINTGGKVTAVEIDAIRERLDVVLKPMQGLLSNAPGYAGTALLGDGAVLLVLDVKEILP